MASYFFYYICKMERYVFFQNSASDYILLPVSSFVGGKYFSSTVIDLYFEKAPFSYKIPLTVGTYKGDEVLKTLGKLFSSSVDPIIVFSDTEERFDVNDVTAVGAFTINPFSTPSTPNLDNTNFTERPSYVDFSTLKLKRGDQIYYNKRLRDSVTGEKQKQTTPTVIGIVDGEPTSSRIVCGANVGQDVCDDFLNGGIKVYALRRKSTSGRKIYSYPITQIL